MRYICLALLALSIARAPGAELRPYTGAGCAAVDEYFVNEVWAKVAAESCLKCHKPGGDAEDSKLILRDPSRVTGAARIEALRFNRAAFAAMAQVKEGNSTRLLLKSTGKVKHGGKEAVKLDSAGHRILAEFVKRVNAPVTAKSPKEIAAPDKNAPPFFSGIAMLDDRKLVRRATLSLAGRLPTETELAAVSKQGLKAMPVLLDALMKEDAFYDRLREGFNDIFLTLGVDGNADQTVLSYEHFTNRHWYQNTNQNKEFLEPIKDAKARQQAGYKLADDYRKALLGEPMKLIEHVVRNDINRFILARLDQEGLKPAAEAARAMLMRRVYYDLIGLPPKAVRWNDLLDPIGRSAAQPTILFNVTWRANCQQIIDYAGPVAIVN